MLEKTIKKIVTCEGIGVHTGRQVLLTLHPAPEGFGIRFKRTDTVHGHTLIPALWNHVSGTRFSTSLANSDQISIGTVEHIMAALAACSIDNILIEINGPEIPILDGSSSPFVQLIEKAGVAAQSKPKKFLRVLKKVTVEHKDTWAILEPNEKLNTLGLTYEFKSRHQTEWQTYSTQDVVKDFAKDLSAARTFGFLEDAEALRQNGLAQGASLDNTVVFDGNRLLNDDGLRYEDECLRHKALDVLGDLYLAGHALIGRFHGHLSGHSLNNQLLKTLMSDPTAWTIDTPADQYNRKTYQRAVAF
ncbi:MAG: UDP-3-O-acyl-N-acetylglucosamine deacetylase [Alphaproteobacteria bacterium]